MLSGSLLFPLTAPWMSSGWSLGPGCSRAGTVCVLRGVPV